MLCSPQPDHLQSFNKKWASALHKIYPDLSGNHVATHSGNGRSPLWDTTRDSSKLAVLGAYPLTSMINHGCSANVMRVELPGDRVAIVATRQIAPGEQIFEAY
ncbi:hypothetical protein quinque_014259 [Culex quinquefasciatus]